MHLLLLSTLLFLPGIKPSNDLQTLDESNTEIVPIQEPQHEKSLSPYHEDSKLEKPYEKHIAKKFMNKKSLKPARELKFLSQHDDKYNEISSDDSDYKSTPKYDDRAFEKFKKSNKHHDLVKFESKQKDQKKYDHFHSKEKHGDFKFVEHATAKNKGQDKDHENQHLSHLKKHNHDRNREEQHLRHRDHERSHDGYYRDYDQKINYNVQNFDHKDSNVKQKDKSYIHQNHERYHNRFDVNHNGKKNDNFKGRLIKHDVKNYNSQNIKNGKEKFNPLNIEMNDNKRVLNNMDSKGSRRELSRSEEKDNNFSKEYKHPNTGNLEKDFIERIKKETFKMKKHAYEKENLYKNKQYEIKERKERVKRETESDESDYSIHDGESEETTEKEIMEHNNDFDDDMIIIQDKSEEKTPIEEEPIQKTNAYVSCNGETGMCHRVKHKDVDAEDVKENKGTYHHEKAENDETWLKLLEESIKRDGIDIEYH